MASINLHKGAVIDGRGERERERERETDWVQLFFHLGRQQVLCVS